MNDALPQIATVGVGGAVYGGVVALDDPAELLHDASKLQPSFVARQLRGAVRLENDARLRASTARSVRRRPAAERVALPPPAPLATSLDDVLRHRRSARAFGVHPVRADQLSALLFAGYGITGADGPQRFRTAPSGGALYPLELYVAAHDLGGLPAGVFHYDPFGHDLEILEPRGDLADVSPDGLVATAPVVVVIAAAFWRSRFKYGLRGYRFAVLEAGHVAQNLLLAATALGLAGVVVGGFFDGRLDALLDLDGVDESTLVTVCFGSPAAG